MKVAVDHLAEAELLGEVIRPAEQVDRRRLALEQFFHAREQHAVGVDEVHLLRLEILLERLHGRIVAAGLVADRNRHAGEIGRIFDLRIGGDENAGRRHRIDVGVHLAVAIGGRDVDGPVAGAAHVRLAAFLERLIGADLVALVVNLAVGRAHQLAEFVFEAFLAEIVLLLRHPFLQAEMRFDEEFRHVRSPFIQQQQVSRLVSLAALGNAPGTDHLDVVVHQRARAGGVAQLDQVGELGVNFQDVPRELGCGGDVAARPGDVFERYELHDEHTVVRGLGDREMEIARQPGEGVEIADRLFGVAQQARATWRYRRPLHFPRRVRRRASRSRAGHP